MMTSEFTERTGIEPTLSEYEVIEEMYYEFDGDKNAFCKDFIKNNRMVEALRRLNDKTEKAFFKANKNRRDAEEKVADLEDEVLRLKAQLEKEQEWKPYEDEHNVKQTEYEKLAAASDTRELSDDEAADMIANEFGFDRAKIKIVHEVAKHEINRHNQTRRVGMIPRKALFNAWDWNYIVFNVKGNVTMGYEMHNGELRMYWG